MGFLLIKVGNDRRRMRENGKRTVFRLLLMFVVDFAIVLINYILNSGKS